MNCFKKLNYQCNWVKNLIDSPTVSRSFSKLILLFSLLLSMIVFIIPDSQAQFRASVVKVDITPSDSQFLLGYGERKSIGTHDHIFHRIVVLDDGKTQFYLISSDFCLFSPSRTYQGCRFLLLD